MQRIGKIKTKEDLIKTVNRLGFLPFFTSRIPGFSLEDHVSYEAWYQGRWHGRVVWPAWEWKADILREKSLVYGKFFEGKAGFISPELFPHFCNFRRDGYDFDARYDDNLASYKDKGIVDYLTENGPTLTKNIKEDLNYVKGGNKGFETVITRLQMQTYVLPVSYEFSVRKSGEEFGWGNCRYGIADDYWGKKLCRGAYKTDPKASYELIFERLQKMYPSADENEIKKFLK